LDDPQFRGVNQTINQRYDLQRSAIGSPASRTNIFRLDFSRRSVEG